MNFNKKIASLTICLATLQMVCNEESNQCSLHQEDNQVNQSRTETEVTETTTEVKVISQQQATLLLQNLLANLSEANFELNGTKYSVQIATRTTTEDELAADVVVITCADAEEMTNLLQNCANSLVDEDTLVVEGTRYTVVTPEEAESSYVVTKSEEVEEVTTESTETNEQA